VTLRAFKNPCRPGWRIFSQPAVRRGLTVCKYWSVTILEYLPPFLQLAHSFWIVSFCHKKYPIITTSDKHQYTLLFRNLVLVVYRWPTCECTFCRLSFLLRIWPWKLTVNWIPPCNKFRPQDQYLWASRTCRPLTLGLFASRMNRCHIDYTPNILYGLFMVLVSFLVDFHYLGHVSMQNIWNVHHTKKTTSTCRWRKWTAEENVTKTAGRVKHNHNRTTAGRYNINKKGTSGRCLVRGRGLKIKIHIKDEVLK
jgi:hypothetical protein